MDNKKNIELGSDNIFEDLGSKKAPENLLKAQLAHRINSIIQHRHVTQAAASKILGIPQSKVSLLSRGKLTGFSVAKLFTLFNALDRDVEIVIRPKARRKKQAGIELTYA